MLVAGGTTGGFGNDLSTAEIYDPATGLWTVTGSMAEVRSFCFGVLIPGGKVLVAGGGSSSPSVGVELYDPSSGTWTSTGALIAARSSHTTTLLTNGTVLVSGGGNYTGVLRSAELYDPTAGTWASTGSLAYARSAHTATSLPDGRALISGGIDSGTLREMAEIYDPGLRSWTLSGSLKHPRSRHTATLLGSGEVLLAGGAGSLSSVERFDPETGISTATNSLQQGRVYHTATPLSSGKVLIAGGFAGSRLTSAELFDGPIAGPEIAILDSTGAHLTDGSGTIDFGIASSGGTSAAKTLTIRNYGTEVLLRLEVMTDGIAASDFSVNTSGMLRVLRAGGATTFDVTFRPTAGGARTAVLHIASDDRDENAFDIPLTGSGLNAPTLTMPPSPLVQEATSAAGAAVSFNTSATDVEDGPIVPNVSPPSGSIFPIGDTTVNVSATDSGGAVQAGSFIVRVRDTTAPAVSAPENLIVEATSNAGATVSYSSAVATDSVGVASLTYSRNSGLMFPMGLTTVTATAKDSANNIGSATFTVTVRDTTPPAVSPPGNVTVEATSPNGAAASYSPASASDTVGVNSISYSRNSGMIFPLGVTSVTATARDGAGNVGTGTFSVTVRDTTAPTVTAPTNRVAEATSAAGATVNFPAAGAADAVGVASVTYSQNSGTVFAIGTSTVTVTAKDAANNIRTATFTVLVRDTTAPLLTPPANVSVEATGADGGLASYSAATASDSVGVISITYSKESGTRFPIGSTTVTATAKDAANNTRTATFTVTVVDTKAPVITPPANVIAEATSAAGATVTYPAATATDLVGVSALTYSHESGTVFPLGSTTVTATAKDAANNQAIATFTVVVSDTVGPRVAALPPQQQAAGPTGTAALADYREVVRGLATDAVGVAEVTQSPAPTSTVLELGVHPLSFIVTDTAGNHTAMESTVTIAFTREPGRAAATKTAITGELAPGAGTDGLASDARLTAFGVPAISDFRELVAKVTVTSGRSKLAAIYWEDGAGASRLAALQGRQADGFSAGVTYKSFLDPVLAPNGALAIIATVQGTGITASNNQGVWTDAFGSALEPVLLEGSEVPGLGGRKLKSIISISLRDGDLLALLTLQRETGFVTATDDTVLVRMNDAAAAIPLLREGTELTGVSGSLIKTISILRPALGSPGQGRWHGRDAVLAKVSLAGGETHIVSIQADSGLTVLLSSAEEASMVGTGVAWKSFGLPSGDAGSVLAATARPGAGGVTAADDAVLLQSDEAGLWNVLARENDATPISTDPSAVRFSGFFDPVRNDFGEVAFLSGLRGTAVSPRNKAALFSGNAGNLALTARLGAPAPDENGQLTGAVWSKFVSYALPDGLGGKLIFVAETTGGDSEPKNKVGLWAVDSTGLLRRLIRTGVPLTLGGSPLATMTVLGAVPGSYGTARSYNATGSLALLAAFADKSQALVRVDIP
ncbi:MAG TPA: HYR domain-containing protein [Chthoniobacteraceae bacterium]